MDSTTIPLKGVCRYDGTGFAGWQRQDNGPTVQAAIEDAFAQIAGRPVPIQGAGRTDAGVHALGQVFSCRWPGKPPVRLRHAVSKMLSPRVRIESLEPVPESFNARFSARGKRYVYAFDFGRAADPFAARHAWHVPYRVDLPLLEACLPKFIGRRDFAGFQSAGSQMKTTVRTVHSITLRPGGWAGPVDHPSLWHLEFHGDAFLYKMVRNICGTLIEVARGRFEPEFIDNQLAALGPFRGHCAPAQGLALAEVFYDPADTAPGMDEEVE
jgi:tRNA pseudouridine38-40 synthase